MNTANAINKHHMSLCRWFAMPAFVMASLSALASVEYFNTDAPDLSAKNSLVITNAIGAWPGKKVADRMFIELENLDEAGTEVLKIVTCGIAKKGKKAGKADQTLEYVTDLPDCGRRAVVVSVGMMVEQLDPAQITELRFSLDKGILRRFAVRRVLFLAPKEEPPKIENEAPRRQRQDERDHVAALEKFREECGGDGFAVGQVSSMESIRPRAGFAARKADGVELRLAKNEYESIQIAVASMKGDLKDARVEFSALKSGDEVFAAENFKCSPVGYVEVKDPARYMVRPGGKRPSRGWWPDPILDFTNRTDIAEGDVQTFWVRVKSPKAQKAGVYSGEMKVVAMQDGKELSRRIPVCVRVNDFELPDGSMLPLAMTFSPTPRLPQADKQRCLADTNSMFNVWRYKTHEYADFLSEYKLSWDSIYNGGNGISDWAAQKYQHEKGKLGMFNLRYMWYAGLGEEGEKQWYDKILPILRGRYENAKKAGIADHAYFYGFDELGGKVITNVAKTVELLHREFPGVKVMTTARDPKLGVDGSLLKDMDIFCPATCFWNPAQVNKSRAAGHEVWWYFCNVPSYPLANSVIEAPPIELRSFMGAQTVKFRPDGFLYYQTTAWNSEKPIMQPFSDWGANSYITRFFYHGDGYLMGCGGPDRLLLATLRLENFRDGLEDYAYAKLLEAKLAQCKDTQCDWAVKARAALAIPTTLVKNLSDFSIDPAALYAWRNELADLIESVK